MVDSPPFCIDIQNWRASTPQEVIQFFEQKRLTNDSKRSALTVRRHLKPVDVYTYLRCRFGLPNGFQNALRRDDSDNLVHWDFNLKADEIDIWISGASREIQIVVSEAFNDDTWQELILAIRSDYRRVRTEKSKILQSLEKYIVFQNKFVSLSELCAQLHKEIKETEAYSWPDIPITDDNRDEYHKAVQAVSERADKLYANCLTLRLVTPIMAEAYINMVILLFCKNVIRNDRSQYEQLLKARIPERLRKLPDYCDGFARPINGSTTAFANFMRVMTRRNFELHGNVDPVREALEVVYFEGRRPIFATPGNHIEKFHEQLEKINNPSQVVEDYEAVHLFLIEIADCLKSTHRQFFDQVIGDAYPGFEVRKKRATRILPDHLVMGMMQGVRYDDDLAVTW